MSARWTMRSKHQCKKPTPPSTTPLRTPHGIAYLAGETTTSAGSLTPPPCAK